MDLVYERDNIFHAAECGLQGWCDSIKDPTPCYSELNLPQGIKFHGNAGKTSWTISTGETISPDRHGRYVFHTCPANLVDRSHFLYLQLYVAYKDGFLPYEGGLAQQSHEYVQAMRVISSEFNRIEKDEMDKKKKRGTR